MVHKMRFDIRDIPAAARYGLSARKLWIYVKALLFGWACVFVFGNLGYLAAGATLDHVWQEARLLPLPAGVFWESLPAMLILAVGLVLAVVSLLRAGLKVARITFEQIRGDDFYSGRDAEAFAKEHFKPVIITPLVLLAGIILAVVGGLVLGLLADIPGGVGPVIAGIVAVPAWALALLVVLAALAFIVSFWLVPAIVASTKGDSFESLFELFSTITSQPWRLVLYNLVSGLVRMLGLLVFAAFAAAALKFVSLTMSPFTGGDILYDSVASGLRQLAPGLVGAGSTIFSPVGAVASGPAWSGLGGVLCAISGVLIFLTVGSYWLASCTSGWTLTYLALRHRKDGEDLLQRADDEEYREFEREYGTADESSAEPVEACEGDMSETEGEEEEE